MIRTQRPEPSTRTQDLLTSMHRSTTSSGCRADFVKPSGVRVLILRPVFKPAAVDRHHSVGSMNQAPPTSLLSRLKIAPAPSPPRSSASGIRNIGIWISSMKAILVAAYPA